MSLAHVKYLMIGGGIAASSAAEAIRVRDPNGLAMLVGQEITRPYRESRVGVRLAAGSAVLGSMAAGAATALLIRVLDRRMPPTASAAVTAAVLGAGASAMAAAGRSRMRAAWEPAPEGVAT